MFTFDDGSLTTGAAILSGHASATIAQERIKDVEGAIKRWIRGQNRCSAEQTTMELKRVLGFTSNDKNSFAIQARTGNIVYVAGCVVVLLDPKTRVQQYIISESKQTITTLAISDDGTYLATADCGSQKISIRIWRLPELLVGSNKRHLAKQVSSFTVGHQTAQISAISFSANNEILVLIGETQTVPTLSLWDWRRASKLATHKLNHKVISISFSDDNSYFITVGEATIRYWYIKLLSGSDKTGHDQLEVNSIKEADSISIVCRSASLGSSQAKEGCFCDIKKCSGGARTQTSSSFCITKQGLLCELNDDKRLLHRWVDLRTSSANCLAVGRDMIVVGCSNGIVRCFSTNELKFLKNLPKPHSLGTNTFANRKRPFTNDQQSSQTKSVEYPNLISLALDEDTNTIACLYNDRSIYVWDLGIGDDVGSGLSVAAKKRYSALYHSSCIWGIDVYPAITNTLSGESDQQNLHQDRDCFVTCSSDDTIRVWTGSNSPDNRDHKNSYADDMAFDEAKRIIFTDPQYKYLCDLDCMKEAQQQKTLATARDQQSEAKVSLDYDSNEGLRCLKWSPDGKHLAAGSRSGTIRVFDLTSKDSNAELKSIAAHDAEVLCLAYSDPGKFDGYYYLASSSRDKLIHLFDAADDYKFLQTIDDHSSSITAVRFVNNRSDDCLQLISCGTDQKIVFRNGRPTNRDHGTYLEFITQRIIEGKATFYDMEVDSESSCIMTACQDRMIRLFNVAQAKYQSGFKGSNSDEGTIIKLALDPSCTFLAASCTDKTVSIYDYQRGECIATISEGLSDLVTDMKFTLDGRHLIICSGNGCIFVWSSPMEIANASSCLQVTGQSATQRMAALPAVSLFKPHLDNSFTQQPSADSIAADVRDMSRFEDQAEVIQVAKSSLRASDTNHENSEEDLDDDHRALRSAKTLVSPTGLIKAEFYLDDDINNSDDGQLSQICARSQSASISRRLTLESSGGPAVSNVPKYFQSREELDKISLRQKYIHDSLITGRSTRRPPANSSLSGRFIGGQVEGNHGHDLVNAKPKSAARAKSLSRLSLSSGGQVRHLRRRANSSGDELSSGDESNRRPVKSNRHSGRYATLDSQMGGHLKQTVHGTLSSGPGESRARRKASNHCYQYPADVARRNSDRKLLKSDCENENYSQVVSIGDDERRQQQSVYCQKLDLTRLDPSRVHVSRELCQNIVEELRLISKFATRLHQRLQSGGSKNLANFVALGVQNALDILSIVPPRALVEHRFRSQLDLSTAANPRQSSSWSSAATAVGLHDDERPAGQVKRQTRPHSVKPAVARRSSIGASPSSMAVSNVIGSAAAVGSPTIIQGDQSEPLQVNRSASHASSLEAAKVSDSGASRQELNSASNNATTASSTGPTGQLNIDQVLEAYSDRLFKMVQQRMDWNGVSNNSSSLSSRDSTSAPNNNNNVGKQANK